MVLECDCSRICGFMILLTVVSLVRSSLAAVHKSAAETLGRVQRIIPAVIRGHQAALWAAERGRVVWEGLPVGILVRVTGGPQAVHRRPLYIGGKHASVSIRTGERLDLGVTVRIHVVIGIRTVIVKAFAVVVAQGNLVFL